jgi:hypothetical protein
MEWIWAGLAASLISVAILFGMVWRLQRKWLQQLCEDRVTAGLNVLGDRMQEWDREVLAHREKMAQQLRLLQKICDRAKEILERNQAEGVAQPASFEENELKTVFAEVPLVEEKSPIPTLQHVEETKKRLKQGLSFDLRSLLRDQLA